MTQIIRYQFLKKVTQVIVHVNRLKRLKAPSTNMDQHVLCGSGPIQ